MPDPTLPPEIEEIIFINALKLKSDGENALNLLLVARRIHAWLMQVLIETISIAFKSDRVLSPLKYPFRWDISTLERYGVHTRYFFIWDSDFRRGGAKPAQYFSLCPNITNLVLWCDSDLDQADVESLSFLPLTHLSVNLERLPEPTAKVIELYSRITHLELLDGFDLETGPTIIQCFTSLTHIAVPECHRHNQDIVPFLVGNIPTLQILIVSIGGDAIGLKELNFEVDHPGVVGVSFKIDSQVEDWLLDVQEGRGMWGFADEAVRERKGVQGGVKKDIEP
ncbi:hypothetical protein BDN72DRAFT_608253 [Pluteus cervinus]|uniref:Uncharacterized protein n=1 Tax=Pluteus cervinus TaxID=181527 RepID=A0ACD3AV16_9AGAR|nr:hypothetical protein BDN72DRAFT_608253 [Pluteus cervinus]